MVFTKGTSWTALAERSSDCAFRGYDSTGQRFTSLECWNIAVQACQRPLRHYYAIPFCVILRF